MEKRCPRCKTVKDLGEFGLNRGKRFGVAGYCRICLRTVSKEKRKKYRDREWFKAMKRRTGQAREAKIRELVWSYKKRPCEDCKVEYPPFVMHFDHRDIGTKLFTIGNRDRRRSDEELVSEIMKCDVVCANCHAIRTYRNMTTIVKKAQESRNRGKVGRR